MNTAANVELDELERYSSVLGTLTVLRGMLAMAFGVVALANPRATVGGLVIVFAVWAFVDAVFAFIAAVRRGKEHRRWGWYVFEGLVSTAAGVVALAYPAITVLALVVIVAARALLLGVLLIVGALAWRSLPARWLHVVTGIVSVAFGVLLLLRPLLGALALVWTMGIYAVVFGLVGFILGIEILGLRALRPHGPAYGH